VVGGGQAIGADAGRRVRWLWSLFCVWQHSAATWPKVLPSLSASTALMLTVTAESHGGSASERSNSAALGVRLPNFAASRDLCLHSNTTLDEYPARSWESCNVKTSAVGSRQSCEDGERSTDAGWTFREYYWIGLGRKVAMCMCRAGH
jgi:hypothetical protein